MSTRPRPEENPVFAKLREMRAIEEDVTEKLETLKEKISKEARALYTGARDGHDYSYREIARAVGVAHNSVVGWVKRGSEDRFEKGGEE